MTETTTIRVDAEVIRKLRKRCAHEQVPMSRVAKRLFERLLNGEFSGSFADVIREQDKENE